MKNKFLKVMKTIALTTLAVSIVVLGNVSMPNKVQATEVVETTTSGVQYVKYNNVEYYGECFQSKKAPEYNAVDADGVGYVFGGWFERKETDDKIEYEPIEENTGFDDAKEQNAVVAKFVPAQVLSVKCQNWAGTDENSDKSIVRVISAVDSRNYSGYGFEFLRKSDNGWIELGCYESKSDDNRYYSTFNYYKEASDQKPSASFKANDLFGKSASHFTTCTLGPVPDEAFGTIICIKPFWDTLDGTRVYGLTKYAHVEDGYLNYINVPVNINILNDENGAVAGMLNVKSENGLQLVDVEYGRLFDEMDTNTVTDSEGNVVVRCVGNTSTISQEAEKKEMDIYVNLRFQGTAVEEPTQVPHYTFTVTDEEFCDSNKNILQNDNVWNIKY